MKIEGGCYCGAVRYAVDGDAAFTGQCHCRECQYISGGSPNVIVGIPETSFKYIKGAPKSYKRSDLNTPVTREFCAECGTHLLTRAPGLAGVAIVKLGTLDKPDAFGNPQMAIYMVDKQAFHQVPPGIPTFERTPG